MRITAWLLAIGCGASTPPVTAPPADAPDAAATVAAPKWHPRNGPPIEQLLGVHRADGPTFAADGSVAFLSDAPGVQQAFVVKGEGTQKESAWTRLLPAETERISHVVAKGHAYFFTRDAGGDENFQILRSADGKTATDLTAKPKVRHELGAFSDDGKEFAFSSTERNGKDFDIYVQGTQTGAPLRVFDADGSYTAESFSPDGKKLAILHERSSFDHELVLLDARAPAKTQKPIALVPHEGIARFEHAEFSKDGKSIFVVSDLGSDWMKVSLVDVATKKMDTVIDEPHDVDLLAVRGNAMAIAVNVDGWSEVRLYDVTDPKKPVRKADPTLPRGVASDLVFSDDGKFLAVAQSGPTFPNEIFRVEVATGKSERLTESDHAGVKEEELVSPTLEHVKSKDGIDVPVFVFRPKSATGKAPAIVSVHGGPEAQAQPMFNPVVQFLVGHGYVVAQPNIRGSTGYGKKYAHLDDKEKREDSIADVAAVNAWLRTQADVDPARIAVMGGSYGGYATLAAITLYPDIWAASCDIVGIANFRTFLEKTAPYRRALREAEYGALATEGDLLDRLSPIHKTDRIKAPLFVIHGANDPRVPLAEAEQIVAALKARKVRIEYMKFDDEGHGLARRPNRIKAYGALAKFFDEVMGK